MWSSADIPSKISNVISEANTNGSAVILLNAEHRVVGANRALEDMFSTVDFRSASYDEFFWGTVAAGRVSPHSITDIPGYITMLRLWSSTVADDRFIRQYGQTMVEVSQIIAGGITAQIRRVTNRSALARFLGLPPMATTEDECRIERMLDATGLGLAIVDGSCALLWQSPGMMAILDEGDLTLDRDGRICAPGSIDQDTLLEALAAAAEKAQDGVRTLIVRRSDKALPLAVSVVPSTAAVGRGLVALIVSGGSDWQKVSGVLRDVLGLSPTEAAVSCAIAQGLNVENLAGTITPTENVTRQHIRNAFAKLRRRGIDIDSQHRLTGLVLRIAAITGFSRS